MNKKIIFVLFAFITLSSAVFAAGIKFSADAGLGFMNHTMFTKYKENSGLQKDLEDKLKAALGTGNLRLNDSSTKDSYNAFMTGIDMRIGVNMFFAELGGYLAVNLGLPTKIVTTTPSPLDVFLGNTGSNKLGGSIILDTQAGVYLTFLQSLPINVHLGAGLAVNWIRTQREIPSAIYAKVVPGIELSNFKEVRSVIMVGGGFNAGISYFFIKNVGINLGIHDSIMVFNSYNHRYYPGQLKNGTSFTYTITNNNNVKDSIQRVVVNNFGIKIGVALKI